MIRIYQKIHDCLVCLHAHVVMNGPVEMHGKITDKIAKSVGLLFLHGSLVFSNQEEDRIMINHIQLKNVKNVRNLDIIVGTIKKRN